VPNAVSKTLSRSAIRKSFKLFFYFFIFFLKMNQFQIAEFENAEVENLNFYPHPYEIVLSYPNPILIIDTRTGSYKFIIPGDYHPDEDTDYDENAFYLLPNTAIEYHYLLNC
jgi:hypothetical protein